MTRVQPASCRARSCSTASSTVPTIQASSTSSARNCSPSPSPPCHSARAGRRGRRPPRGSPRRSSRSSPRAAASPGRGPASRRRASSLPRSSRNFSGPAKTVLYSEAQRAAIRRLRGPPEPPITSGIGRCTGFGCASRSTTLKCSPSKLNGPSAHERVAILELLFEGVHPRPELRQVEAVGLVLAVPPAGAEPGVRPAAADLVDRRERLGEDRGMAEGRRRDHRPQPQLLGDRGQRRERGQRVERPALAPVFDREVVVGAEQRPDPAALAGLRRSPPSPPR